MDTEGPENVPTAAHPDDRRQQHPYRYSNPTDTEGPESVTTAAHPDEITVNTCHIMCQHVCYQPSTAQIRRPTLHGQNPVFTKRYYMCIVGLTRQREEKLLAKQILQYFPHKLGWDLKEQSTE